MPDSIEIKLSPFLQIIRSKTDIVPEVGIICGSGLSNLAAQIKNPITIQYSELGHTFPHSAVEGHKNELIFGQLGSKNVVCFRGRFHFYEGWTVQQSTLGIRLAAALGVKAMIITNAAGGVTPEYKVGDVMVMDGHINMLGMTGTNPLIGPNVDSEGPRFPPVNAYDENLIQQFSTTYHKLAEERSHPHELRRGCYVGVSGPNYETPHEIQMFRHVGANAVGMSTVNEVITACHVGVKVLGLSLITNSCIGTTAEDKAKPIPNHAEVIEETQKVELFLQTLVAQFVNTVDLSAFSQSKLVTLYSPEVIAKDTAGICPFSGKTSSSTGGCPFMPSCPVATKSDNAAQCPLKCPFTAAIIGGVIGAAIAICGLITYAHAPLFKKNQD